ncbi:superoxide reductase [Candidatus Heimdallarchaeota archaeon B3_Heim]|nr:MAG: superoxide reductase [Candidatus Heimdallarchaeota archaeon B3_Heim]
MDFNKLFQSADWKTEKHSPVIQIKDKEDRDFVFIKVMVGKEIAHPNQTNHHISWISLYFVPDGEKFPLQVGKVEFTAHGESAAGPDTSTVYTEPKGLFALKTGKSGNLVAFSYCNIHGLWRSEEKLSV